MPDAALTTKAWTYNAAGYPHALHQSALPIPATPATPHTILLRTHAAALNPVDMQLMNLFLWRLPLPTATHARVARGHMGVGADFAGTVLAAGTATGLQPGDAICGLQMAPAGASGSLSEVMEVDARGGVWTRKPPGWSWAQAAALPLVWLTAYTMVEAVAAAVETGPSRGRNGLVVLGGSSAVGMYIVHLARQRGWRVLATCSGRNIEFVRGMGADVVVDYTREDVPAAVGAAAPAAIIDCVGGTACLRLAPRYVTIVGDKTTRLLMGGAMGYWWNPQMVLRRWLGRCGLGVEYDCLNLEMRSDWLEEMGRLSLDKVVIDGEFGFGEVREAFERLNTGRARGKVVVTFDG